MTTGAITSYIDVAQLVLYAFWIFFAGLIIYLHRENKREGYPLESDRNARTDRVAVQGFPAVPRPKTFITAHGGAIDVPSVQRNEYGRPVAATPVAGYPGAALQPTGNPMLDGVGPGSYALRADKPDLTVDGRPKIVPLRVATDYHVESRDPKVIGMPVYGADGAIGGTIVDVWVDLSEPQIRYYEFEVTGVGRRLVPATFTKVSGYRNRAIVRSILSTQFAQVPALANPDRITMLEEEKVCAYYGGGTLYAEPSRIEPLI